MTDLYDRLDQRIDDLEAQINRLHPEAITPMEWIALRRSISEWIQIDREVARRLRELNGTWQQPSATSWLSSILSKIKLR